ncbi:MAG: hypothetical protein ACYCTB_06780 [bacterium]
MALDNKKIKDNREDKMLKKLNNNNSQDGINLEKYWENFVKEEGLLDYNKIPLQRAEISGWVKIAFWFLRIYIVVMVVLVIIGFSRIH